MATKKLSRTSDFKESFWHRIRTKFFSASVPTTSLRKKSAKHSYFRNILNPLVHLWHQAFVSAGSVMIRTKIMGIVTLGFILSIEVILLIAWQAYRDTAAILNDQLRHNGVAIGKTLANYAGNQLQSGNQLESLSDLAHELINSEKNIAYVLILGTGIPGAGMTEAVRTVQPGFTGNMPDNNPFLSGASEQYTIETAPYGRFSVIDVAVIIPGSSGVVRIGLTDNYIIAQGLQNLRQMLYLAAAVSVLWLLLAYFLSSLLVRPVHRLLEAIRAVEGAPSKFDDPLASRKDEISRLGVTFGVMNKELQRREEIRKQLLNKVINAQEQERKRIARELHDQTGQSLTSMIVGLKVIESHTEGETQKRITDMKQMATTILHEIHNLAVELRPSSLDDLGLIAALKQYVKEYTNKFGIETDFQVNGLDDKRLSPDTEIAMYRIIQEALTNIVKHSAATKASVLLASREGSVVAIVEDNGKGFDVEKVFVASQNDHKLGLYGMQERAALIGGNLTIESTWMGTTVFAEAPVEGGSGK